MNTSGTLSSGTKRFVPVSENIIREAMRISERSGIPLRDFVEKILETVVSYMRYKPNLLDVIHTLDALEDLRRIGCVMLPQNLVRKILESASEEDFRELLEELGKAASWYGVVAKAKRGSSVEDIKTALQIWLPSIDVYVASIDGSPNSYKLVISPPIHIASSPRVVNRLSIILETIVSSIIGSMGGTISNITNSNGIISVVFSLGSK